MDAEKMKNLIDKIVYDFNLKEKKIIGKERWVFILISDRKQIFGLHLTDGGVLERTVKGGEIPPKRKRSDGEIVVTTDSETFRKLVEKEIGPMKVYDKELKIDASFGDLILMQTIL
jgi:hypothetical protein